jgi:hypothetical protein
LPCLGAAAVLYAAEGTITAKVLSLAPMRAIGLISYSLYLWHWPVLVYGAYFFGRPLPLPIAGLAILLSIVLATCSWWFVEGPVRRAASIRIVWLIGAGCLAGGLLVEAIAIVSQGFPGRYSSKANAIMREADAQNKALEQSYGCPIETFHGEAGFGPCIIGRRSDRPPLVVIGDSHAMATRVAINQVMRELGETGVLISVAGCSPLIGLGRDGVSSHCTTQEARIKQYVDEHNPKAVLLVGSWRGALLSKDTSYKGRQSYDRASRLANVKAAMKDTVAYYQQHGIKVGVLLPLPGARDNVPSTLARGFGLPLTWSKQEFQADFGPFYEAVASARPDVVEDLAGPICQTGVCIIEDGHPIYMDDNHINESGTRLILPVLRRAIIRLIE